MLAYPLLRRLLSAAATPAIYLRHSFSPPSRQRRFFSMSVLFTAVKNKSRLRGVVFDMDGTLTVPVIDFGSMYREVIGDEAYASMRAGGNIDILHHIETWGPQEQQRAYETIARFERQGLDRLQIMPGAMELCQYLDSRKIRRGLITRNVKDAVDLFHQRFGVSCPMLLSSISSSRWAHKDGLIEMEFCPALSREFRPYKPDPAPLLHICTAWDVSPNEVLMIGDSLRDDVVCGKRAGAFTCLLDETERYGPLDSLTEDTRPDFKVSSLVDVHSLLNTHFELHPQVQTSD